MKPPRAISVKTAQMWLSISGYAVKYAVHRRTVYKWIDMGLLVTYRVGRTIRVQDQPPLPANSKPVVRT